MSTIFELDQDGYEQQIADARLSSFDANEELDAGAAEGIFSGLGQGIMRGGAKASDFLATVGKFLGSTPDAGGEFGQQLKEEREQAADELQDEIRKTSIDYWTPSSREVGVIGRTLGGFGEIALPLIASGGNPSLLIGTQGIEGAKDVVDQGVDAQTAVASGTVDALATAVGFKLPFLGKTLAGKMATGAGGNVLVGAGATELQRELFEGRGYEELAKNYDPLDMQSRAIDALSGLAFGALDWASVRSSDRAAAAAANNAKHYQQDTAPGIPQDHGAIAAHTTAMEQAFDQMMRGEPVSVEPAVRSANFAERPARVAEVPEELREFEANRAVAAKHEPAPLSAIERAANLSDDARNIETRFANDIEGDLEGAIARYANIKDAKGGKVLNTDVARELSKDYLKDRTRSNAVHEPASWLVKKMYERKLAEAPGAGEDPLVVFSAGGTGAGKTTGLEKLGTLTKRAQIIYDTNMNTLPSGIAKIDQALAAGKNVVLAYTFRDPIEALRNGALPRAMRQENEFGSGRTVPVSEHVKTHVGARDTVERIAAHYAGDARVSVQVLDNSRGPGQVKVTKLGEIPKFDEQAYNRLRDEAHRTVSEELEAGRISEAVGRGFLEHAAEGDGRTNRAGDRGQHQPSRPRETAEAVEPYSSPALEAVRETLAQRDIQVPTGELDADGNAIVRSGREVLAEAEANIALAQKESVKFEAAVSCFLTRGEDAP